MRRPRTRSRRIAAAAVALAAAVTTTVAGGQSPSPVPSLERGSLPGRWTGDSPACEHAPPFMVHEYNPTFIILRQSGCTNFEKPFLYLVFGGRQALLVDTGAPGADVSGIVGDLLRRHAERQQKPVLPLLVVHSHGHSDHTAGDAALGRRSDTRVVEGRPEAVARFFSIKSWPRQIAQFDLGARMIDVIPIPGHEAASIAIYDRQTGILLTGDTLYPGRLYVRDAQAFEDSITRLVDFTSTREVAHILGAHIENSRTPYVDYPQGTTFQPDEHSLDLARAHLLELQDGLRKMGGQLQRRPFQDFTIWPVSR